MELKVVRMNLPEGSNLILGQSHFIKTAEDLFEAIAGTAPGAKFGIAFSEASGDCLVRLEGNDEMLIEAAKQNSLALACGHTFIVLLKDAFPINVLNAVKDIQEVCTIFCATANPLEVVVAHGPGQRHHGSHRRAASQGRGRCRQSRGTASDVEEVRL